MLSPGFPVLLLFVHSVIVPKLTSKVLCSQSIPVFMPSSNPTLPHTAPQSPTHLSAIGHKIMTTIPRERSRRRNLRTYVRRGDDGEWAPVCWWWRVLISRRPLRAPGGMTLDGISDPVSSVSRTVKMEWKFHCVENGSLLFFLSGFDVCPYKLRPHKVGSKLWS